MCARRPYLPSGLLGILLFSACLVILTAGVLPAQQQERYPFEHISLEEGLSQSSVINIMQDRKGFLWFTTQDGLNMYDGYSITVFRHDPQDTSSLGGSNLDQVYEDRKGNIWVTLVSGGIDRINRASGAVNRFRHSQASSSLSADHVTAFLNDSHDNIWIGTSNGLNRATGSGTAVVRYQFVAADSASANGITAIMESRSGVLYIGTRNGLKRYDYQSGRFVTVMADRPVTMLMEDRRGTLWIGTERGLLQHDPHTGVIKSYLHTSDRNSLAGDVVTSIVETPNGRLCIGTEGGLSIFNVDSGQFTTLTNVPGNDKSLSSNQVGKLVADEYGFVWIITAAGKVDLLNVSTKSISRLRHSSSDPTSIGEGIVGSILEDRSGTIWLGLWGGGVNKFSRKKLKFRQYAYLDHHDHGFSSKLINAIFEDRDRALWIGTNDAGLDRFNPKTDEMTEFTHHPGNPNSIADNSVTAIAQDVTGTIWVGTQHNGLDEFQPRLNSWKHHNTIPGDSNTLSSNSITAIIQDHLGLIWVGTMEGLNCYDPHTGQFHRFPSMIGNPRSLPSPVVRSIAEDRSGTIWVGTAGGGLSKLDRGNVRFFNYLPSVTEGGLRAKTILQIVPDSSTGVLWLGSTSGGLARFDPATEKFVTLTEKEGLPNNRINGILQDNHGILWLSTNRGLSKYNPTTGLFRNYDYTDGLQSNEFTPGARWRTSAGEMFFGGINGLSSFHPDSIQENDTPPPVVVTAFKKFDKPTRFDIPITELQQVELAYTDNFFSIEFAALDFTAPVKNRYAYRLEGFDPDWIYSDARRYASYTNLDPGTYIFRFKGSNNDGVWSDGTPIRITITPPYWKTAWFRLTLVILLVGGTYGGMRYRFKAIQNQKATLEHLVEERTHELEMARDLLEHRVQARTQELQRINESLRQEILDRHAAQEEVERLKEFNENLVHTMAEGIAVQDQSGRISYVNPATADLLGYEPEELIGKHWRELVPSNQYPIVQLADERRTKGLADHYELQMIRKDGSRITLLVGGSPLFKDDELVGTIAVFTDITALKKAEEQVRDQAALIDLAHDAIAVCDLEGHISYWNKGAETTYGWSSDEARGRKVQELLHREDSRVLAEALRTAIDQGEWSGELRQVNRAGAMVTVNSRWTLLRDHEGYPRSILMINTDVSEKVRLEMQFLRSQRMESIGTLAGGIAHDLNNVLAPILLAVRMLGKTVTDDASKKVIETLDKSARRGADIVKQVLTFARGMEGRQEILRPETLIQDMATLVNETFPKSIQLSTNLPPDLWPITGDPTQLHQVLLNLCVNARDAMPAGGRLLLSAENAVLDERQSRNYTEAKPGSYVVLTVSDSGTGMPPDVAVRIFEPFFTTKGIGKGTGLGLSTVNGIVKGHRGFIAVYSEPARGSSFKVYLPAAANDGRREDSEETMAIPQGDGELILVVDDEAAIRQVTKGTLEAYGYRVVTADDGMQAESVFNEHRSAISLVITDMMMPLRTGPETIRILRSIDPSIKIVVASGMLALDEDSQAAIKQAQAFLLKPYSAEKLLMTVGRILGKITARAAAPQSHTSTN